VFNFGLFRIGINLNSALYKAQIEIIGFSELARANNLLATTNYC
jgi:hypothetical protein